MDHKPLPPVQFFALATSMVLMLLTGCGHKISPAKSEWGTLEGIFSNYHAALGSGNGMIFRVKLPPSINSGLRIDSFYLKGESRPFTFVQQPDTDSYVEVNLFVANKQPAYGESSNAGPDPVSKKITDSIFIAHRFYPSWIIATRNSVKQQFEIISYKEIIPKSKE